MRPTAILIPSRTKELLDLCMDAHRLFTPKDDDLWAVGIDGARDGFYGRWNHEAAAEARDDGAELLVFQNDDTVVTPGWLDLMLADLEALRAHGRPGLLGACSNHAAGAQAYIGAGGLGNGRVIGHASEVPGLPLPQGWRWAPVSDFDGPMPCRNVMTQFAMIETAAYFEAGGFDLDLPAHACSDIALCYRLVRAGFVNAVSRAFVCHFGSRTLREAGQDADLRAGRAYMEAKYPDHEEVLGFRWGEVGR